MFYDITASTEITVLFLDTIAEIAKEVPYSIYCWWRHSDARRYSKVLDAGADKVSINSAALAIHHLLKKLQKNSALNVLSYRWMLISRPF